jgi:broad specificity phosphatase PhoE
MVSWPVINSDPNPVWNKVRVIEQEFLVDKTHLTFTVVDEDNAVEELVRGRDNIGIVTVPLKDLVDNKEKGYELKLTKRAAKHAAANHEAIKLFVRLVPEPATATKTVFFIRHGESKWNQAQAGLNLINMLKEYDHGLSQPGKDQAERLSQDIAANPDDPDATKLLSATTIFCSPLTRAIQTTLIGLQAHPVLQGKGLELEKDAREIKKIGGFDTVGMEFGVEKIKARVTKEMKTLYSEEEKVKRLTGVKFDGGDAVNEWWTHPDQADSAQAIESRIHDLLQKLQYAPDETIVVTGHSLLWKHMYKTCGTASLGADGEKFGCCKMPNCGVVKCEIDFSKPKDQVITSIKLLFGKTLLGKNRRDSETPEQLADPENPGDTPVPEEISA